MGNLTLPAEGSLGDIERDFLDNEPPGLFPDGQDSLWGQMRKLFADPLQVLSDELTEWYQDLDPGSVDADDIHNWENELGIPVNDVITLDWRRVFLLARRQRGPFTRARRKFIVEAFIAVTFGNAILFTPGGVPFIAGGLPFLSGEFDLSGLYSISEDIPNFYYHVILREDVDVDMAGLTRELTRITPAGIQFDITIEPIAGLAPSDDLAPSDTLAPY